MLYVLVGEAGQGKDSLIKYMCENYNYEKGVYYTTRPKRKNEVDGVDYYFVTEDEFSGKEFVAVFVAGNYQEGVTYRYGITQEEIDKANDENYIVQLPPSMAYELKAKDKAGNVVLVRINCDKMERIKRQIKRGDIKEEVVRRLITDEDDFSRYEGVYDYELNNEDDVERTAVAFLVMALHPQKYTQIRELYNELNEKEQKRFVRYVLNKD